jgi:site-specific recombinase XerD
VFLRGKVYWAKIKGPDGRWRNQSLGTKDYPEASRLYEALKAREVIAVPNRAPRFHDYAEKHVEGLIARDRRARTIDSVRDDLRKLDARFGAKRMDTITAQDVEDYQSERRAKGVAPATVNGELRTLRAILRRAVEHKIIREMPCRISFLKEERKAERQTFTREEIERLIAEARKEPRVQILLTLASKTGLRRGELLWLEWDDIRPRPDGGGDLIVRGKADGEVRFGPKGHAERIIPLTRQTMLALKEYQLGLSHGCRWVIPNHLGERMTNPTRLLEAVFKGAQLYQKGKLLHALRHTAATEWLGDGADLETVRALLGHRHVTTTALYVHATAERMRAAVERADEARIVYNPPPAERGLDESVGTNLVQFLVHRP